MASEQNNFAHMSVSGGIALNGFFQCQFSNSLVPLVGSESNNENVKDQEMKPEGKKSANIAKEEAVKPESMAVKEGVKPESMAVNKEGVKPESMAVNKEGVKPDSMAVKEEEVKHESKSANMAEVNEGSAGTHVTEKLTAERTVAVVIQTVNSAGIIDVDISSKESTGTTGLGDKKAIKRRGVTDEKVSDCTPPKCAKIKGSS